MADGYTVIAQTQEQEIAAGGTLRDIVTVTFETVPGGQVGTVRIPLAELTPANVEAKVRPIVQAFDAVQAM